MSLTSKVEVIYAAAHALLALYQYAIKQQFGDGEVGVARAALG
ncbi:hypothetical protein [Nonomuraea sp. NPDC005650]